MIKKSKSTRPIYSWLATSQTALEQAGFTDIVRSDVDSTISGQLGGEPLVVSFGQMTGGETLITIDTNSEEVLKAYTSQVRKSFGSKPKATTPAATPVTPEAPAVPAAPTTPEQMAREDFERDIRSILDGGGADPTPASDPVVNPDVQGYSPDSYLPGSQQPPVDLTLEETPAPDIFLTETSLDEGSVGQGPYPGDGQPYAEQPAYPGDGGQAYGGQPPYPGTTDANAYTPQAPTQGGSAADPYANSNSSQNTDPYAGLPPQGQQAPGGFIYKVDPGANQQYHQTGAGYNQAPGNYQQPPQKKSSVGKGCLIAVIITVVVLVLMGSCTYFALRNFDLNEVENSLDIPITADNTADADLPVFNVGDTWEVEGLWRVSFSGVSLSEDRNQYADQNPAAVYIIDYAYENLGYEGDLYVDFAYDGQIIDTTKTLGYAYPIGTERYAQGTPVGATCQAQTAIGVDNAGPFTVILTLYDNDFVEHKAKFNFAP